MPENEALFWERISFLILFTIFNNYFFKAARILKSWDGLEFD
jgi:hypothetical protein